MRPPDRPPSSIKQTSEINLQRRLTWDLEMILWELESLYLNLEGDTNGMGAAITKERYARFEAWLADLAEGNCFLAEDASREDIIEKIKRAVELYEGLSALARHEPAPRNIRERYKVVLCAPDEFFLNKEDIPTWNEIPSSEELQRVFRLNHFSSDYKEGRKLNDSIKGFQLTDQDLVHIGYGKNDPAKRQAFLRSVSIDPTLEAPTPMKVFRIWELIERKQAEDPSHPDHLTTKELFEAFDDAGVRPAHFKELITFSKQYWKPIADRGEELTKDEMAKELHSYDISALGSVFSASDDNARLVPNLRYRGKIRRLSVLAFEDTIWRRDDTFLVARKEPA